LISTPTQSQPPTHPDLNHPQPNLKHPPYLISTPATKTTAGKKKKKEKKERRREVLGIGEKEKEKR